MADLSGQVLGQYVLRERIGRGGMANVYRARQESMDRDVAIKVMSLELTGSEEFVARFEREARVIAKLQHPHILPVIDFGRSGDMVYLVMQLIEGGVLSTRLMRAALSTEQANRFVQQIASALDYAHRNGVIHRDLKPNNVLLDPLDNSYLTDFGIAKMLADTSGGSGLTATGSVMGTPAYMAPEQWRSEPVDARTDIYALGVILYEMLVGALPFQADTPFAMMYKHFDEPPPLPRAVNPVLPEPVERIMLRALAKDPADRYPSAKLLADDLNACVKALPSETATCLLPRATPAQVAQAARHRDPSLAAPTRLEPPAVPLPAITPPQWVTPRPAPPRRRSSPVGWLLAAGVLGVILIGGIIAGGLWFAANRNDPGRPPATVSELMGDVSTRTAAPGPTRTPRSATAIPTLTIAPTLPPAPTPTVSPTVSPTPEGMCGGMFTQMQANAGGRTTLSPNSPTHIRQAPDVNAPVERAIPPGQTFWLGDGPACGGDILWWQVEGMDTDGRWFGWIAEGSNGTYWIEPFDTGPVTCPGAPPPRLVPGQPGRITLVPDLPSRLRAGPGTEHEILGQLGPGQTFEVISGPVCDTANRWRWWLVEGASLQGWVAEGPAGEYWMEPWP